MTAATKDRDLKTQAGKTRSFAVEAATKIFAGTIVCLNAAGFLTKGITATTLKTVGVALDVIDNSAGAQGAIAGDAHVGVYGPFANSSAGDLIAVDDVTADCYIVDDQTVALTSGGSTRSIAGKIWHVDSTGVWVKFN